MRIIIDTGVLWVPQALRALAALSFDRILPAVAFAQRSRQIAKAGRSPDELQEILDRCGIQVEALSGARAARFSIGLTDDNDWARLARNALIAGHLGPDDVLWTTDPEDFRELGVSPKQILIVET
jgi:hypothetical protein